MIELKPRFKFIPFMLGQICGLSIAFFLLGYTIKENMPEMIISFILGLLLGYLFIDGEYLLQQIRRKNNHE